MKKKIVSMIMIAVTAMSLLAGCGSSASDSSATESSASSETAEAGERVWKFSHTRAEGTENDIIAKDFAEKLTSSIDGLEINIYPNNQLGDYTVVQEAVGMNEVQLAFGSVSPTVDSTLSVQIAPYLASDWDEAKELYNSDDGAVTKYVSERLAQQNIKLLACVPKYFGAIMSTKEAKNIDDPSAPKGLKMRVPQQKAFEAYANAIGFSATPLPTSDTFTSLQTGVVEAVSGGGAEQYYNDYGELVKDIYMLRTHMECHWITMSMDTWNSLSSEEQDLVAGYAREVEDNAFATAPTNEQQYLDLLADQGVNVYEPSDDVIDAYRTFVRENVWPEIASEYGDAWEEIVSHIS